MNSTKIAITAALCIFANVASAQCPVGQTEVTIEVLTDEYGYEGYWELVPGGNACGTGTIVSGGNAAEVGCNGGGPPYTANFGSGYADNVTIPIPPTCYNNGMALAIKYIDDYGDGGFHFIVKMNGFPVHNFTGTGANHTFNFVVGPPPPFDLGVTSVKMPVYVQPGNTNITGTIFNYGSTTITSFDLNYTVNGGSTVTQTISSVNIPGYTSYNFTHPTPWNATNGNFNIAAWATNLNGSNADLNLSNDRDTATVVVGPATPNIIDNYFNANHSFTTIAGPSDGIVTPRDLDFHPILDRYELWVVLKLTENSGGKTAKITNAGGTNQNVLIQQDGNAWHFMSLPTGIAFSDNGNFATSPGVLDANHNNGQFTGPTLWSSDPLIYAQQSGGNGSHLDMLHECPYSMGIAWEKDNAFWVYDSHLGDLMRNDFQEDHGPGNSDHSDGRIRSYQDFPITRINLDIPCHLVLDENKQWLYIVNGGQNKIQRMDINTGSQTGTFVPMGEPLAESSIYTGTTWSNYITAGTVQPSGIDVIGNRLIVSDYSNGDIIIYDCSGAAGVELGRIHTGQPGIAGVKIGPDGKIWYVNHLTNEVKRVDYTAWPAGINPIAQQIARMYPNPSNGKVNLEFALAKEATIEVYNIYGKLIVQQVKANGQSNYSLDLSSQASGNYIIKLISGTETSFQKLSLTK